MNLVYDLDEEYDYPLGYEEESYDEIAEEEDNGNNMLIDNNNNKG
jgi:hypothetical protein